MKEAMKDLLGIIGRIINFLFPFKLPQRIYRKMGFQGTFVFNIENWIVLFVGYSVLYGEDREKSEDEVVSNFQCSRYYFIKSFNEVV